MERTAWLRCLRSNGALTSVLSRSPTCPGVTRRAVTPKHHLLCFLHRSLSNCLCLPKNSKAKLKKFPDGSAGEDLNSAGTLGCRGKCLGEKPAHEQDLEVGSGFATSWTVSPCHGQQVQLEHPTKPRSLPRQDIASLISQHQLVGKDL